MPAFSPEKPLITRIEPLWTPLGVQMTPFGERYWFDIRGQRRAFKPGEMYGINFLAHVYPDIEHWRRLFPYGVGRRVDTGAAMSYFIRACQEVGVYDPPEGAKPVGRPRRAAP